MVTTLAALLVLLTGSYLVGLAALSVMRPTRARQFLGGFASSAFTHLLELFLRLMAGVAILLYAQHMQFPDLFRVPGWIIVTTTIVMFGIPWRWHRDFAQRAVPIATRHLGLFATGSLAFGIFVILSVVAPIAR